MAIEKIRKNGKGSKIIGWKVRLPSMGGDQLWNTWSFMCRDYEELLVPSSKTAKEMAEVEEVKQKDIRRREKNGLEPNDEALNRYTVGDIVDSCIDPRNQTADKPAIYEDSLDLGKGFVLRKSELNKKITLMKFANRYRDTKLYQFTEWEAREYVRDRLKETTRTGEPVNPNTVQRDIADIKQAWIWARGLRELRMLVNPWEKVKVSGAVTFMRQRGVSRVEMERLIIACRECNGPNRFYVPLALRAEYETGMRRKEVVNLIWNDIDFEKRRIKIRQTKTDKKTGRKGRTIALPPMVGLALSQLRKAIDAGGRILDADGSMFKPVRIEGLWGDRIFPRSWISKDRGKALQMETLGEVGNALSYAFELAAVRAGMVDSNGERDATLHDLRSGAKMHLRRQGLDPDEVSVMMKGIKCHYDVLEEYLETIQVKLDRYLWKGRTQEEMFAEVEDERRRRIIELMRSGLSKEEAEDSVKRVDKVQLWQALEQVIAETKNSS